MENSSTGASARDMKMYECFCRHCGEPTGGKTSEEDAVRIFQCFDCFLKDGKEK